MEKRRVNVYLDHNLVELAHLEVTNLSELINNLLIHYLSTSSVEEIDRQIKEIETKVLALKQKKHDMMQQGMAKTRSNGMYENILKELKEVYTKRKKQGQDRSADEKWIIAPRSLQKCKMLGKQPLEVLNELEEWYDSTNQP